MSINKLIIALSLGLAFAACSKAPPASTQSVAEEANLAAAEEKSDVVVYDHTTPEVKQQPVQAAEPTPQWEQERVEFIQIADNMWYYHHRGNECYLRLDDTNTTLACTR